MHLAKFGVLHVIVCLVDLCQGLSLKNPVCLQVDLQRIAFASQDSNVCAALSMVLLEHLSTLQKQKIASAAMSHQRKSKVGSSHRPPDTSYS